MYSGVLSDCCSSDLSFAGSRSHAGFKTSTCRFHVFLAGPWSVLYPKEYSCRLQISLTHPWSTLPRNPSPRRDLPINFNHYTTKKSVSESMLDVALFMSNATRLKAVLERGPLSPYYTILVTLLSISLLLQVVIGILLIITARMNLNEVSKQQRLNQLNNTTMAMVFITVIINIFITAFGVQKMGQSWPTPKPY
uniref:Ninjurin 2 n=1 Tax=Monodelphis domestica TaxID=13616 RepID=A0A5F8HGE4_MONDO